MRLLFKTNDGYEALIDRVDSAQRLTDIGVNTHMAIEMMKAGGVVKADGGEYSLVEDDYCTDCGGTGEISTDESDGEGHIQRGVGTQKCHCKINTNEDDQDED